uniref:Calmodulin n=2 Tax=Hemiselmis andersenii TaxID=464988 RepID=A0A7S1GUW7_HEMAN
MEKANLFQKRRVWNEITKDEFVQVMLVLSKPSELEEKKQLEKDLFKVFKEFDADQSGNIDKEELGKAMEKLGKKKTDGELDALLLEIDDDGSGEIGFVEFASLFGVQASEIDYSAVEKAETLQKLREAYGAFKAFDADNSNSVDATELGSVMKTMGHHLTKKELDAMLSSVDEDGSGEIDFREFCQLLNLDWLDEFTDEIETNDDDEYEGTLGGFHKYHSVHDSFFVSAGGVNPPCAHLCTEAAGVSSLVFSPVGRLVACCGLDEAVRVYDVSGDRIKRIATIRAHRHYVLAIAWSPSSEQLVSVGADKNVVQSEIKGGGRVIHEVKGHTAYVRCVDWSMDGDWIATGSSDKSIKLWGAATMGTGKQLLSHSSWIRTVKFSPDSCRLVSGGGDQVIIVWSVPDGQILQRIAGHESTVSSAVFLQWPNFTRVPPLISADYAGKVLMWLPDKGMQGIMHATLISCDHLPWSSDEYERYLILSVGRNRASVRTSPKTGTTTNLDFEREDISISCAVWDDHETIRVQLFERPQSSHRVKLLGETKCKHREVIKMEAPEQDSAVFSLVTGEGEALSNEDWRHTSVRLKFRFEPTEHHANLTVHVEDAKNLKRLDGKGAMNTYCRVVTQKGQEFATKVVMNNAMPRWHTTSTFGIGPSTAEVSVSVLLLEANGEMSVCTHRTRRYTPFMSLMELPPTKKPSAGCLTLAVKGSTWSNRDTESKPPASKTSLCAEEPRRKEMRSSKKIPLGEPICSLLPLCVLRSIHPLS